MIPLAWRLPPWSDVPEPWLWLVYLPTVRTAAGGWTLAVDARAG